MLRNRAEALITRQTIHESGRCRDEAWLIVKVLEDLELFPERAQSVIVIRSVLSVVNRSLQENPELVLGKELGIC